MNTILNKKTIIVTGATGQMGSYFSEFLLEKGFNVIGAVRRVSTPNVQNIQQINNPNFLIEAMDLGDSHSINYLIEKYRPDYFINCAANSFVGDSWKCPEQHFEYNTLGVLRQLEAIKRFCPQTRYLNFGSSEEFGDVAYVPQDEDHPPRPRSPYGASKVAARQIIKVYRESYNLYAVQPWCFNYESERRGEEFVTRKITMGVARIINSIEKNEKFEPIKLGNLDSKRDWSHCSDFVEGIWRVLNQDEFNPNYNGVPKGYVLASGETHTIREFVEKAFKYAGLEGYWSGEGTSEAFYINDFMIDSVYLRNSKLVAIDPKFFRPAEVDILFGNPALVKKDLGWKPKNSFDNLVKRMVFSDINGSKKV